MKRFANEQLVRIRTDLNLTQEAVAAAIGVDVRTYRRYESGAVNDARGCFVVRNASRAKILSRLFRELGVEENELITELVSESSRTAQPIAPIQHAALAHPVARGRLDVSAVSDGVTEYLARVQERCRFIDCVGLGNALQVRLPINGFYVPLRLYLSRSLEGCEVPGRFDPEVLDRGDFVARDVPLEDALRTAAKFDLRGVVLLGDAGAGKTTAVRYLAWRIAQSGGEPFGLPRETVPVLIRMRRCRPEHLSSGLASLCSEEWNSPHSSDVQEFGRRLLKNGSVLWIFDGLDEIASTEVREAASLWIHQAMLDRPSDTFVVTSRYAGYSGDSLLRSSFLELHIQPLDVQQSQSFIRQWYGCVESQVRGASEAAAEIADQRSSNLITRLDGRELRRNQFGVVAANPLLLSILCLVDRRTAGAALRRADLYHQCVSVLTEHWLHKKNLLSLEQRAAYLLLRKLAWELHRVGARAEMSTREAAEMFSTEELALLHRIRDECGLIVTARPGYYAFLHLTFQEYFSASFAHECGAVSQLVDKFGDSWWREVILLFSGLAASEAMSAFVAALLKTEALEAHPDLFAQCVDAAQIFPLPPLLEELSRQQEIGVLRLRGVLRLLRDQDAPRLRVHCEGLLRHEDGGVVGLAKEILFKTTSLHVSGSNRARDPTPRPLDLDFVHIPGGEVMIGCTVGHVNERPKLVELTPFSMSRYPVTNSQYQRFLSTNSRVPLPRHWFDPRLNGADQPVVGVSWFEAVMFCEWIGARLPTEYEWEVACRAGTRTEYWAGDGESALRHVGWYAGNAGGRLHSVGELPPNPFGLYDMHGNVWEWCDDWYAPEYGGSTLQQERVLRGGFWHVDANRARSAYRGRLPPGTRGFDLGFRVAR